MAGKRKPKTEPGKLSREEELFCQHYALHGNNYQAFMHAFTKAKKWKRSTVDVKASVLLATAKIQERITVLRLKVQAVAEKQFEVTAERVLSELAAIAFTPAADYARWGKKTVMRNRKTGHKDERGQPIYEQVPVEIDFVEFTPSDELTETQRKAIAGPELAVDKFGNTILTVKPLDRMKALDRLAKITGLDESRTIIEHRGQVAVTHEVKQLEDAGDEREALKMFEAFRTGANAYALKG